MRIFVGDDFSKVVKYIAGEMINIEQSKMMFDKGELLPKEAWVNGYPNFNINKMNHTVKSSDGVIFITRSIDKDEIENILKKRIEYLETEYKHILSDNLMDYQTVKSYMFTNLKAKNTQKITYTHNDNFRNNIRRLFTFDNGKSSKARFTWRILFINEINMIIDNNNIGDSISHYINSIFYDLDGISKYGHNQVDFEFNYKKLKGYDNVISEKIKISDYSNPVSLELTKNKYLYENCSSFHSQVSNYIGLNPDKIYHMDIANLKIQPCKISYNSSVTRIDICFKCGSTLYEDNYVLCGDVDNPDNEYGIPICPLCMHCIDNEDLIKNYLYIFRVTFPMTIEQAIENSEYSDEKKEILYVLAREGIEKKKIPRKKKKGLYENIKKAKKTYFMIGNKYLLFKNISEYIFNTGDVGLDKRVCFECT